MQSLLRSLIQRRFQTPSLLRRITALVVLVALSQVTARAEGTVTDCTQAALKAAIEGGGTVTFANDCTITLTSSIPIVADTIIDAGSSSVTITASTATNAAGVRLFRITTGVSLTLINLTLSNGRSTNGGAVYNQGNLIAINCAFSSNRAAGRAGVAGVNGQDEDNSGGSGSAGGNGNPGLGGAIYNDSAGVASFTNCTFRLNGAIGGPGGKGGNGGSGSFEGGDGGKGGNAGRAQGGAIYNLGKLFLENCTLSENSATGGNGGVGGTGGSGSFPGLNASGGAGAAGSAAAILSVQRADIFGCTFNDNVAKGGDSASAGTESNGSGKNGSPGGNSFGGGLFNLGVSTVVNCTFFTNQVTGGAGGNGGEGDFQGGDGGDGGTASGGGIYNSGNITLTHVTLSAGRATGGPGGANGSAPFPGSAGDAGASRGGNIASGGGSFVLQNSIVAASFSGGNGFGTIIDDGVNISDDATLGLSASGSQNNTNPRLGSFDNHGGPTKTIALRANSPAIDAARDGFCPPTDQRGVERPLGARCDIGSYETNYAYNIQGRIVSDGSGVGGVTVTAGANVATTDEGGFYTLAENPPGVYSVVPSLPCYEFEPPSVSVRLGPSTNDVNFSATGFFFTISGRVTDGKNGLADVTVNAGNSTTTTDADGFYTLSDVCEGTYFVEPSLSGYAFEFVSVTVGPSTNDVDFVASPLFSISGRVTRCAVGVVGVSVSSDFGGTTMTDAEGRYRLGVQLPAGTYSVFPRNTANATFYPANRIVMLGPDATGVDFFDSIACFTSIRRIGNGQVELSLAAAPDRIYTVEASTNLMTWEALFTTNGPANGMLQFIDARAGSFASRFYRATSP